MGRGFGRLDRGGGGSGEPLLGEDGRRQSGERSPARTVVEHGRRCDLAHHLAAGAVVFRDAERLAKLSGGHAPQARRHGSHAKRVPGARGVVVGGRGMQSDARATRHFVAHDQRRQRLGPGEVGPVLGQGGERRQPHDPDVTLGRVVAVVAVEVVDVRGAREGGARQAGLAAVEEDPRGVALIPCPMQQRRHPSRQDAGLRGSRRSADAERVEQQQSRPVPCGLGKVLGPEAEDEIGHAIEGRTRAVASTLVRQCDVVRHNDRIRERSRRR